MSIKHYGVLKARPVERRLGNSRSWHYQLKVVDEETDYRIAVNVQSDDGTELLCHVDQDFRHPVLEGLPALKKGFTALKSEAGGLALDFLRSNLFDPEQMQPLPASVPGPDNDLNELLDGFVQRAMSSEDALVYAFGQRWGPEPKADPYFGFRPGNGIHDIHMNQGNGDRHARENGVFQDGALLIHLPSDQRWVGVFLAFSTQSFHSDDAAGTAISRGVVPVTEQPLRIAAARPIAAGGLTQTVTLANASHELQRLKGWRLGSAGNKRFELPDVSLAPGEFRSVEIPKGTIELPAAGGAITLLDPSGLKAHGVAYTRSDVKKDGWSVVF